jgi:hypothetical protein
LRARLARRLGDHLFLVVDDVDRLLEQAIGAQLDGDVVLALELGAIGAQRSIVLREGMPVRLEQGRLARRDERHQFFLLPITFDCSIAANPNRN